VNRRLNDKRRRHSANKLQAVGTWTLKTKLIVGAVGVYGIVIIIATMLSTVIAPVGSAVDAAARFLHVSSFTGDDGTAEAAGSPTSTSSTTAREQDGLGGCMSRSQVDPSFTALVESVPTDLPLDQATGWLIYAAPHQQKTSTSQRRPPQSTTTPDRRDALTIDQFRTSWQQVLDGTDRSSRGGSRSTPDTVLDVVEIIDPATSYDNYAAQAYVAAIYLLATGVLHTDDDEAGQLIGGLVSFCRGGTDVLPQPELSPH
jgi:hypothetical protein